MSGRVVSSALGILFFKRVERPRAGETISYGYDARGRLVTVSRSGSVNNGVGATYTLDKEGNRTQVVVAGVGGSGVLVANPDGGNFTTWDVCQVPPMLNVLANDSDSGGHYPLQLVSRYPRGLSRIAVVGYIRFSGGWTAGWGIAGTYVATYVVENSIHEQASAQATFVISGDSIYCD